MRYAWVMALVMILTGCAGMQPLKHEVAGLEKSEPLLVQDLRPAKEKEKEIFSLNIFNDAYGVIRNADDTIDPAPIRLFKHRVFEKFAKDGVVPEVKVHHLVSYTNNRAENKKFALGAALGGAIGGAIVGAPIDQTVQSAVSEVNPAQFEASLAKEFERGNYSVAENPNGSTVVIIYLDAEINGKRSFIRKLSPIRMSDSINPYIRAVETTIEAFLAKY